MTGATIKFALVTNAYTPNTDSSTGHSLWSDASANEIANGFGYTTGGSTLLPSTNILTAAMIDNQSRLYGLIDPVAVTTTSRTDGTLSQTISEIGGVVTVQ